MRRWAQAEHLVSECLGMAVPSQHPIFAVLNGSAVLGYKREQPFGTFTLEVAAFWLSFELITGKGVWETISDPSSFIKTVLGKGEKALHMNAADSKGRVTRNLAHP